jgi:hypothetical protein
MRAGLDHVRPDARASFDFAVGLLSTLPLDDASHFRRNLAAAWMNRAALLAVHGGEPEGLSVREASGRALDLIAPLEGSDLSAAEVSLKSRLLWLGDPTSPRDPDAWLERAGDLVDDGLALGRIWEQRGAGQLQARSAALFRLGVGFYREHQPHFLAEFMLEHLVATPGIGADFPSHLHALECACQVRQDRQSRLLQDAGSPAATQWVETMRELGDFLDRLAGVWPERFGDTAESAWLRARTHELSGRAEEARQELLAYQRAHPGDGLARETFQHWGTHRGGESAARSYAAEKARA